jgi:hypothetical protein
MAAIQRYQPHMHTGNHSRAQDFGWYNSTSTPKSRRMTSCT